MQPEQTAEDSEADTGTSTDESTAPDPAVQAAADAPIAVPQPAIDAAEPRPAQPAPAAPQPAAGQQARPAGGRLPLGLPPQPPPAAPSPVAAPAPAAPAASADAAAAPGRPSRPEPTPPIDAVEARLRETARGCLSAYRGWRQTPGEGSLQSLSDAVHELRKVLSRIEVDMSASRREEQSLRPIPIPAHRASRRPQ